MKIKQKKTNKIKGKQRLFPDTESKLLPVYAHLHKSSITISTLS